MYLQIDQYRLLFVWFQGLRHSLKDLRPFMVIDMCFLCFSLTNRKKKQTRTENKTHRERTFSVEWLRGEFIHRKSEMQE